MIHRPSYAILIDLNFTEESQCSRDKTFKQVGTNIKIWSRKNATNMSFFVTAKAVILFVFWTVIFSIENIIKLFIPLKYKMKSIAGEITLVTGGGGGLGRLTALRLANLGAIVVIWDVNKAGKHLFLSILNNFIWTTLIKSWDFQIKSLELGNYIIIFEIR